MRPDEKAVEAAAQAPWRHLSDPLAIAKRIVETYLSALPATDLVSREAVLDAAWDHSCKGYSENCDCRGEIIKAIRSLPTVSPASGDVDYEAARLAVDDNFLAYDNGRLGTDEFAQRIVDRALGRGGR